MNHVTRVGLVILFVDELVVGAWNLVSPETFYRYFPTVDLTPPFSEHYARDFGGATLGLALLLGLAVLRPKAARVVPATAAFLVFAIPHFFFHLTHLDGATRSEAVALTAANAAAALIGIAVLICALTERARRSPQRGDPTR